MVDEDFVLGYVTGYNDGAQSGGGSGGGLDDYPVFQNKKFRLGESDFYFMVGDINTGFYDALNTVTYDKTAGAYSLKNAQWYRPFCIILCKGNERFGVFKTASDTTFINIFPSGTNNYQKTTYYLDDVSCVKVMPSSITGEWIYRMTYDCHYVETYSDGSPSYIGTTTYSGTLYSGLYFNADGTISRAPSSMNYSPGNMHCYNAEYFAELMDLMLTLPDIIEEV